MSDKYYLGQNVEDIVTGRPIQTVSRVNILVDSDNVYTAGNDNGKTVEFRCPWGSNGMAQYVLSKINSVSYVPFEATNAIADPALELGDMVNVADIYSMASNIKWNLDKMFTADISAPDSDEIEDEYPYTDRQQTILDRKLAYSRSLIAKTAEEILLEVEKVDEKYSGIGVGIDEIVAQVRNNTSALSQTLRIAANGVTITNAAGSTLTIDGGQIKANSITAEKINATNLKVKAANIIDTLVIGQLPDSVAEKNDIPTNVSDLTNDSGYQTLSQVNSNIANRGYQTANQVTMITNNAISTASISANQITTGTLSASRLALDGLLRLTSGSTLYGYIGLNTSEGGAAITGANGQNGFLATNDMAKMSSGNSTSGFIATNGVAKMFSGNDTYRIWTAVGCYSNEPMQVYSDQRMKNTINYDLSVEEQLFAQLKPCSFILNNDTNNKKHWGFIAQDIIESARRLGLNVNSLAVLGSYEGMNTIAYGELTALNTHMIQKLFKRVENLEEIIGA